MPLPIISVIIPTYKSWDLLAKCLNALEEQTLDENKFEVIVIDNDGGEAPDVNTELTNLNIIVETKPGSYAARNAGLKVAKGKYIAFTDADCNPREDWLSNTLNHFQSNESVDRVAGEIELFLNDSTEACKIYEEIFTFNVKSNYESGQAVTANLIVRKSIFDSIGYFDSSLYSGGDVEWNRRATEKGITLKYVKDVVVRHPTRTLSEILSKIRRSYPAKLSKVENRFIRKVNGIRFLAPPVRDAKRVFEKQVGLSLSTKVIFIVILSRLVRFLEHISLSLGRERLRT